MSTRKKVNKRRKLGRKKECPVFQEAETDPPPRSQNESGTRKKAAQESESGKSSAPRTGTLQESAWCAPNFQFTTELPVSDEKLTIFGTPFPLDLLLTYHGLLLLTSMIECWRNAPGPRSSAEREQAEAVLAACFPGHYTTGGLIPSMWFKGDPAADMRLVQKHLPKVALEVETLWAMISASLRSKGLDDLCLANVLLHVGIPALVSCSLWFHIKFHKEVAEIVLNPHLCIMQAGPPLQCVRVSLYGNFKSQRASLFQ